MQETKKTAKKLNPLLKKANSDMPSPFIVDLKKQSTEREEGKESKNQVGFNTVYEKIFEVDFKKKFSGLKDKAVKIKEKANKPIKIEKKKIKQGLTVLAKVAVSEAKHPIGKIVSTAGKNRKDILIMAGIWSRPFFKFVKLIFSPFYRACYNIGWTFLFIVRFFYFAILFPVKFIFKKLKLLSSRLYSFRVLLWDQQINAPTPFIKGGNRKILPAPIYPIGMPFIKAKFSNKEIEQILNKSLIRKTKVAEKEPIENSSLLEKILPRTHNSIIMSLGMNGVEYKSENVKYPGRQNVVRGWPRFSVKLLKPTFVFAAILLALILPFKALTFYHSLNLSELRGRVLGASEDALSKLFSAGNAAGNFNFISAKENFGQAADNFLKAKDELSGINDLFFSLASLAPNKELKLAGEARNILAAGEKAAEAGGNLSEAAAILFSGAGNGKNFGDILKSFAETGAKAAYNAGELNNIIKEIDENNLPEEYRGRFFAAKEQAVFLENGLNEFVDLIKNLRVILGAEEDKRYLLVFQNNAEARPTGGFIGSFALVDFKNGEMKNLEVPTGGSYDTEAGLRRMVEAPEPFHLVDPLWHFWDANWWPDWPTSARKLEWFYEKSSGPTVDGVISFTPAVMEGILGAIGPIEMPEYGLTMTKENFWENTRSAIEEGKAEFEAGQKATSTSVAEKPKKIIGDLMAKMIKEIPNRLNKETLAGLIKVFEEDLGEKHILIYFNNEELQAKLASYGWDGSIKKSSKDYLSVVSTNIGGGKSDRKVKETIYHEAQIMPDGSIINTVKIERFHDSLKFVDSSGVRNVNWLRVYVPLGSKLIEASGFEKPSEIYFEKPEATYEIDPDIAKAERSAIMDESSGTKIYVESGKTVFANWSMVDPGGTATIYLKYQLPFKLTFEEKTGLLDKITGIFNSDDNNIYTYSLVAQKQSGSFNQSKFQSKLKLPAGMKISWNYPENAAVNDSGWKIEDYLNTDKYWAAIIKK